MTGCVGGTWSTNIAKGSEGCGKELMKEEGQNKNEIKLEHEKNGEMMLAEKEGIRH